MKKILLSIALTICAAAARTPESSDLRKNFANPPDDARAWVYWYFMDGMMTREGLTADLEAMKRAGIGGAIFLEVNIGLPRGPVEFMSLQWQELFQHAVKEADRLGIEIALGTGPGWCGTGGPWVKPEMSMQHLVSSETAAQGPGRFSGLLPQPKPRVPYFGERSMNPEVADQWRQFYVDEAVLAFPAPEGSARIPDADEKAVYFRAPFSSKPGVKPYLAASNSDVSQNQRIALDKVVDLSGKMAAGGRLEWDVPPGNWMIVRFGRTITGQTTRPAPKPGLGLETDKFNPLALDAHFEAFSGRLISALRSHIKPASGLTTLHFDSWEMSAQNWSGNFREEFRKRRGYDLLRYLPAYSGMVVDSVEVTERFLWDVRQTASELVIENHAERLRDLAHRSGLKFSVEPYDMNPAADLALGAPADVPMCEFWAEGDGYDTAYSCIEATSIAHTHGRPIVGAEAFTGEGKTSWVRHPGTMKNQADWAFAMGINRLVFHRYQHQPWSNRYPGLTMGGYGTQYERTQTWWEMSGAWHSYLARCQYLLRQGLPAADILYLTPEGAPHVFRPPASALSGRPALPDRKGYSFDGIDARTLMESVSVRDRQLILPDGMSYRLLILPEMETMTPALLLKIRDLVRGGAVILGPRPLKSPSLGNYPGCDREVQQLAQEIWKDDPVKAASADVFTPPYRSYEAAAQKLAAMGVPPDFESEQPLRYIHRRLKDHEVYFVSNPAGIPVATRAIFRVKDREPEMWDPLSGEMQDLDLFRSTPDGRTSILLRLEGDGSCFIVFERRAGLAKPGAASAMLPAFIPLAEISGPWQVRFQGGRGAPETAALDSLISWSDHSAEGIRYFSGEAVYLKDFEADLAVAAKQPLYLDLGKVEVMAEVTLNGRKFRTLWCRPYRLDVSGAVKPGRNHLEIRVANLWPNRMIGDAHLPPDSSRRGSGNKGSVDAWPQWLLEGKPSPTGRITFASNDPFTADMPLLPSGLIGPVRLFGLNQIEGDDLKSKTETPGRKERQDR
jgi:hypothetical protein